MPDGELVPSSHFNCISEEALRSVVRHLSPKPRSKLWNMWFSVDTLSDLEHGSGCISDVSRKVFVEGIYLRSLTDPTTDETKPEKTARSARFYQLAEGILSALGGALTYLKVDLDSVSIARAIGTNCVAPRHLSIEIDVDDYQMLPTALKKCASSLEILQIDSSGFFGFERELSEKHIQALAQNFVALRHLELEGAVLELGGAVLDAPMAPAP